MKKYVILWFAFLFCLPITVFAEDTTDKLYIDIQIKEDGSLFIRELASLEGTYKGRLRSLEYQNPYAQLFTGKPSDFGGSDIYNASRIKNVKIYDVLNKNQITFESMNHLNYQFQQVTNTDLPSEVYGVYTLVDTPTGIDLKIFNPSSRNSAFYLEYEVEDAVVVHRDVAELAWNILGSNYEENIDDFVVKVHLPKPDSTMRVWGHGPLNGEINRTSDEMVIMQYDFLGARNAVDVRLMFDKSLVPRASKKTEVEAKEMILSFEQEKAELANLERERIQTTNNFWKGVTVFWYVVMLSLFGVYYFKYDKEYKKTFDAQYYRDFPNTYGPEILEYLLKKNITATGFSASILELIRKNILQIEKIGEKRSEYKLVKQDNLTEQLLESEEQLLTLLMDTIGNGKEVTLTEVKQYGKKLSNAQTFLDQYNNWCDIGKREAETKNFFMKRNTLFSVFSYLWCFLGMFVFSINLTLDTRFILGYLTIVVVIGMIIYFATSKKRTIEGNLEYHKWMAFKRFLLDFGRMDEKTLPEVKLWDRYLVYATVLGCADKLEKEMKIKIEAMQSVDPNFVEISDMYVMNSLIRMNLASTVSQTVATAVASSRSSIAASSRSSSGGFGGGMSSGGGSFGGGGGGGRF